MEKGPTCIPYLETSRPTFDCRISEAEPHPLPSQDWLFPGLKTEDAYALTLLPLQTPWDGSVLQASVLLLVAFCSWGS